MMRLSVVALVLVFPSFLLLPTTVKAEGGEVGCDEVILSSGPDVFLRAAHHFAQNLPPELRIALEKAKSFGHEFSPARVQAPSPFLVAADVGASETKAAP